MIRLSLTDLVDIVSKAGVPKANAVKRIKNRPEYSPATDYYKGIRDQIVSLHEEDRDKKTLSTYVHHLGNSRKTENYLAVPVGYQKWLGRKKVTSLRVGREIYAANGVEVSVNPELALEIDGQQYLIKLYFKADELPKTHVDVIAHLMTVSLTSSGSGDQIPAVLDTRRAKLLRPTVRIAELPAVLDAELAYIATIWPNL